MKTDRGRNPYKWTIALLAVITAGGVIWALTYTVRGQSTPAATSPVFTPAHRSVGEAIKHFFFIRSDPQQPIAYTHKVHVVQAQMPCEFCHAQVENGPQATIPNITTCMGCHESVATDHPEIKKMAEYQKRGEDIPWQRVYGFADEAHVRFNHAPHIAATVSCDTCHGDLRQMTVAERVVDHTMGFCVRCHEERKAPNDCMTCHY